MSKIINADFREFYSKFSDVDPDVANELFKTITTKTYEKGELVLKIGMECKHLFFINKGLLKIYFQKHDKEFIMRFFPENSLFSVFDSFLTETPSTFMLVALETTTVTMIRHDVLEDLCKKNHSMETFYRKLVSRATVRMMRRIREMLEEDAAERYNQFLEEHSLIIQRISIGDIAKYLGITQQSLSRIRNQK